MTVLSDRSIRQQLQAGRLRVYREIPLPEGIEPVRPASYDVSLGKTLLRPKTAEAYNIANPATLFPLTDPKYTDLFEAHEIEEVYYLLPGEWLTASTMEWIELPNDIGARLSGKSSRAREGLLVETAGWVDPGWKGRLTFEIKNLGPFLLPLIPGEMIGQLQFQWTDMPAELDYGQREDSHYNYSDGPVLSMRGLPITLQEGVRRGVIDRNGFAVRTNNLRVVED